MNSWCLVNLDDDDDNDVCDNNDDDNDVCDNDDEDDDDGFSVIVIILGGQASYKFLFL